MKEQVKTPIKYDVQAQKKFIDVHIRTIQTTRNRSAILWGEDLEMLNSISESLKSIQSVEIKDGKLHLTINVNRLSPDSEAIHAAVREAMLNVINSATKEVENV
ncbi:hypothetical protein ACFQ21_00280 [Ohtaekwangia kribbensis]|uniref:Uncharacterized protein n=1 Tax=Ohtaekwangia kribbensis TaxID=688913 RepID=A0ABW3JVA0_9BACT